MKKKLISLLLAATMVVSICACGDEPVAGTEDTKSTENTVASETSSQAETEEAYVATYPIVDEEVTLKGLVVGVDTSVSKDRLIWQKVEEVTGINIEWDIIDKDAVATYLASNDWPDFFMTSFADSIVNDYGIAGGRFVNLLDYMEYMPNFAQTLVDYPEAQKMATEINGEMYEFPGIANDTTLVYMSSPYYRTDIFEAAGVTEEPTSVDELYDALVKIKDYTGEAPWAPDITNEITSWQNLVYSAFGTSCQMKFDADADGNVFFARSTEQMKNYYKYMNKLYSEGLIHQESVTMDNNTRKALETEGKVAIIEKASTTFTEASFADGVIRLGAVAPLTSEHDSTQTYIDRSPVTFKGGPFLNANSDYIVEMCKMFDIMYATEEVVEGTGLYGQSFTYGLEGVDWDFTDTSYTFHVPEGYTGASNTYRNTEVIWTNMGRVDAFSGMVTEEQGNAQVRQRLLVEKVHPYEDPDQLYIWTYLKFTDDEQYVIDNKLAIIETYYKKMAAEFITGVTDIEANWEAYCAELDKMGIADVVEVYQAAYDRFMSN